MTTTKLKLPDHAKLTRPEIDKIKDQVNRLATQETGNIQTGILTAKGDILAATASGAVDNLAVGSTDQILVPDSTQTMGLKWTTAVNRPLAIPWIDYPIQDATNGDYFNQNTGNGTIPSGWTQTDAAQATRLDQPYGFWNLVGASGETSWAFKKQGAFNIESQGVNAWKSFWIGPVLVRELAYSADINYYFGVYRNNAGSPDANTYVRVNLNWDSAGSNWKIRGEYKDGTTATTGTYTTLSKAPVHPLWFRIALQNNTNKNMVVYWGGYPLVPIQVSLQGAAVGSGVTWGQVWWQFSMSRGAGSDDRLLIGGIDYTADS